MSAGYVQASWRPVYSSFAKNSHNRLTSWLKDGWRWVDNKHDLEAVGATATTSYAMLLRSMGTWHLACTQNLTSWELHKHFAFISFMIICWHLPSALLPFLNVQLHRDPSSRHARGGDDAEAIQNYEDARIACEDIRRVLKFSSQKFHRIP